jgi:hypothetical protein
MKFSMIGQEKDDLFIKMTAKFRNIFFNIKDEIANIF